jgi:hypothetical protein
MRLLYIVSKGMNDPTLASVPLHIAANGSLKVGQDVSVVSAVLLRPTGERAALSDIHGDPVFPQLAQ